MKKLIAISVAILGFAFLDGCANLVHKGVDGGSQSTALVVEGTPGDPATGSGPGGKAIYGDFGGFFHDAPAAPHSMWGYHWISYAWIPALFGSNTISSEVIVFTYGGDGDNAQTDIAAKGQMQTFMGYALTPRTSAALTTKTANGTTVITTDSSGSTTKTITPIIK
jgi:hypothetical protein